MSVIFPPVLVNARCLLRLVDHGHGAQDARRIDTDRVDSEPGQKPGDLGIVRRRLAANTHMPMIATGAADRQSEHLQHAGIPFIEVECDDVGIAVDAERELGEIVGAYRKSVEKLCELIDQNHIVGNFAHHEYFQAVSPPKTVLRQRVDDLAPLLDTPAERNHDFQVRQPHDIPDAAQRLAFGRQADRVEGKASHGIVLSSGPRRAARIHPRHAPRSCCRAQRPNGSRCRSRRARRASARCNDAGCARW